MSAYDEPRRRNDRDDDDYRAPYSSGNNGESARSYYNGKGGYSPTPTSGAALHDVRVPPPPLGEQASGRPSAMKRSGSASRKAELRPEFPDEASYLGSSAPDLEAKTGRHNRQFREKREGYQDEEGEMLKKAKAPESGRQPVPSQSIANDYGGADRRRPARDDYDDRGPAPSRRDDRKDRDDRRDKDRDRDRDRNRDRDRDRDRGDRDRGDRDRDRDRRKYDDYDDDYSSSRRRRDAPDVAYGSDPIPAVRRSKTDRPDKPSRHESSRRDKYEDRYDSDEEEDRPRRSKGEARRRSNDEHDRRRRYDSDEDKYSDRRRRDDRDYGASGNSSRRDRSRRRYDDDDDDYDRRDRRDRPRDRDRDRDRDRRNRSEPPKEMMIGNFDAGPWVQKAQKHYGTIGPIVTPLLANAARNYMKSKR